MAKKLNLDKMIDDLKGKADTPTKTHPTSRTAKQEKEEVEPVKMSMQMPAELWTKTRLLSVSRGISAAEIVRRALRQEIQEAEKKGEVPVL